MSRLCQLIINFTFKVTVEVGVTALQYLLGDVGVVFVPLSHCYQVSNK